MKKAIFRRILLACLSVVILCSVICAALFERSQFTTTRQDMTELLRVAALAYDPAGGSQQAKAFSHAAGGARVTIVAADGAVLGDSTADPAAMENHLARTEIQEAARGAVGISTRRSETLGQRQMYAAIQLENGTYLRFSADYDGMLAGLAAFFPAILFAVFVSFGAALWLSSRFSDTITRPLAEMTANLKLVRNGGVRLQPDSYRYEELSEMAGDINHLSQEVSDTLDTLKQEQNKIAYLLDNMSEGLLLLDNMENLLIINHSACRAFGCTREDVLGKNIVHATRNIPFLEAISSVLESGEAKWVDITRADATVWEAAISTVQTNEVADISGGVIVVLSDATAQRASQKMRRDFFSTASHELKTPLTSIKGFAEMLTSGAELSPEEKQDFLRRILKETDTMAQLINDIIMISRLESGDIAFEREVVDLSEVVEEACSAAKAAARAQNISVDCQTDRAVLSASRRELRELVNNLVQNAVKYNMAGGRVEVRLENRGGEILLSVYNTGEAIPPEDQQRIFERFYRVDKGRARSTGGTGLGLSIVKHVATQYDASVSVTSKDGEGTTFQVRFPPQ